MTLPLSAAALAAGVRDVLEMSSRVRTVVLCDSDRDRRGLIEHWLVHDGGFRVDVVATPAAAALLAADADVLVLAAASLAAVEPVLEAVRSGGAALTPVLLLTDAMSDAETTTFRGCPVVRRQADTHTVVAAVRSTARAPGARAS
jgi:hypothetical protein